MGGGCPECEPGGTWNPIEPTEKQKKAAERKRKKELVSVLVLDLLNYPNVVKMSPFDDVAKWLIKQGWRKA